MKKTALITVILLLFATSAFAFKIGDEVPDFNITTLSGRSLNYNTDLKGKKPVYLFFWATW